MDSGCVINQEPAESLVCTGSAVLSACGGENEDCHQAVNTAPT